MSCVSSSHDPRRVVLAGYCITVIEEASSDDRALHVYCVKGGLDSLMAIRIECAFFPIVGLEEPSGICGRLPGKFELALSFHLHISGSVHLDALSSRDPEDVVASIRDDMSAKVLSHMSRTPLACAPDIPDEYLSETPRALALNELLCVAQLNVHVRVDTDEATFVLGLAPFESDDHVVVNPTRVKSACALRRVEICSR